MTTSDPASVRNAKAGPLRFVPVIVGPTASGKSDLGVALAHLISARTGQPCEVLAADAFQVYRGMDIGTAKPSMIERGGVPHRLIDLVDPHDLVVKFTLDDWLREARSAIDNIQARGGVPIVVGGTSLYVQSLVRGMFEGPAADESLRVELGAMTPEARRAELERIDPGAAARIHPNDARRTIRALEVFRLTGRPISELQTQWSAGEGPSAASPFRLFVLSWPVEELNRRINQRVRRMMDPDAPGREAPGGSAAGSTLLTELKGLLARGPLNAQAREALGYKQLLAHLESSSGAGSRPVSLEDAVEKIKIETRRFAKNQRTWMKRLAATPGAVTLEASGTPTAELAERVWESLMNSARED